MKRKVLFCVPPFCGGAERVTLTIAKLLDKTKYDIKIVIIGKSTGEIKSFIPEYMEIIHVKIRHIWDFTTLRLMKVFKKERPYMVFCSLMYLNVRVISAAKLTRGIKIVIRNCNSLKLLRFDDCLFVKFLYPVVDAIILQTDEMKKELQKLKRIDEGKLHVISNPIDIDLINYHMKLSKNPYNIEFVNYVFVGRINYIKGLDILIPAFAEVVKKNNKSRLYIVGKVIESDPYFQSLQKLVKDLHLEDYITWTGFTNNPYKFIKYSNCLVLPSRIEGLPNVLLEAMYLQVPVVATRSVPIIDRIVPIERGIVVDVENKELLSLAMLNAVNYNIVKEYEQNQKKEFVQLFE